MTKFSLSTEALNKFALQ